jgi:hypothetical protein
MEEIIEALQSKLVDDFQPYLTPYGITGPQAAIFGDIDLEKNRGKVTAFILPDEETFEEQDVLGADTVEQKLDVFLFMKGKTRPELALDVMRAGRAFRKMMIEDNDLGGQAGYIHLEKASYIEGVENNDSIKGIQLTVKVISEE